MVKRSGRYGDFWGCNRYPTCKGTRPYNGAPESNPKANPEPEKEFVPSDFQKAIFEFVKNGEGHAVVEAVAGSGKTTTIVRALEFTDPDSDVAFLAFNRHIAKELAKRAPKHVMVSTLHSLGYAACRKAYGLKILVEPKKISKILETIMDKYVHGNKFGVIRQLVSLVKANLVDTSDNDLMALAEHYGIGLNGDQAVIFDAVRVVVKKSYDQRKTVIDYDDMCWLPVIDSHVSQLFDFMFVDEAQDLNSAQIQLVLQHLKAGGRIVAVGDRNQSLYGFRGADVNAISNIVKSLKAKTLPLSITYRCPKSHVRLAQKMVPDIQAAEWAKEGVVRDSGGVLTGKAEPGDMVICRTNAPLVSPCFALIRRGVKAVIRGRDIGKGLQVLIRKMKADTIVMLMSKMTEYKDREVAKLLAADKTTMAQNLQDKVETIIALTDGVDTITELSFRIEQVFSDDVEGVVFSSVHRAKGLESKRVYILRPELMPHPMAKQPWELVQEQNIKYVAYTRSLYELVFVR